MRSLRSYVGLLAAAAAIAACGGGGERYEWRHADMPESRWAADEANCRGNARRLAEQQFERDTYRSSIGMSDSVSTRSLEYAQARHDAQRYRDRLIEQCLRNLGYEKVPAGQPRASRSQGT